MGMAVTVPRYTVDDLERFPEDGNRYELLDGMLIVTPLARQVHQWVAMQLGASLLAQLGGTARVVSPGVVTRPPRTQLQPDVLVYPARFRPSSHWLDVTEHWLALEVLSRSSRFYDREFKRDAYFALGVQQVWLVDIEDRSVEVWRSRTEHDVVRDVIRWSVPTTDVLVTIDLVELFASLE
jgi:Uma2 family endonuclease